MLCSLSSAEIAQRIIKIKGFTNGYIYILRVFKDFRKRWCDVVALHTGNLSQVQINGITPYIEYMSKASNSLF